MAVLRENFKINKGLFHVLSKINSNEGQYPFESKFKSAHTISAKDIWVDNIPYCETREDALDFEASEDGNTVIKFYDEVTLTELPNTNGQAYYLEVNGDFIRPFIVPEDVPQEGTNLPSTGFTVEILKGDGSVIPPTAGAYVIDGYSGIILFDEGQTPNDLGWGDIKISVFAYIGNTMADVGIGGSSIDADVIQSYSDDPEFNPIELFNKIDTDVRFKVLKTIDGRIAIAESSEGVISFNLNDVPTLINNKIQKSQLPDDIVSGLVYKGVYNPETNTPDINSLTKIEGDFWIVNNTYDIYTEGNWVIWNGSSFDIWDFVNSNVYTVNGKTGHVVLNGDDIAFNNSLTTLSSDTTQDALVEISNKLDSEISNLEDIYVKILNLKSTNTISKNVDGVSGDITFDLNYENGNGIFLTSSSSGFRADLNINTSIFEFDLSNKLDIKENSISPSLLKRSSGMYDGQVIAYDGDTSSFKFIDVPGLSESDTGTIFQRNLNQFNSGESFYINGLDAFNERVTQIYKYEEDTNPYVTDTYIYSDFDENNFSISNFNDIKTDLYGLKLHDNSGNLVISITNNSSKVVDAYTPIRIDNIKENIIDIYGRYFSIENTSGVELSYTFEDNTEYKKCIDEYYTDCDVLWVKINESIAIGETLQLNVFEKETNHASSGQVVFDYYEDFVGNHLEEFNPPDWTVTSSGTTLKRYVNTDNNPREAYLQNYIYYKSYTCKNQFEYNTPISVGNGRILDFGQRVYSGNSTSSWASRLLCSFPDLLGDGKTFNTIMLYGRLNGANYTRLSYAYDKTYTQQSGTACSYGGSKWKHVSLELVPNEPLRYLEDREYNSRAVREYGTLPSEISSTDFNFWIYAQEYRANYYHYFSYIRSRKYYDEFNVNVSFTNNANYSTSTIEIESTDNSGIYLNKVESINYLIFNDNYDSENPDKITYLFSDETKTTWYKYNEVSSDFEEYVSGYGNTSQEVANIPSDKFTNFVSEFRVLNFKILINCDSGNNNISPVLSDIVLQYVKRGSWVLITGDELSNNFKIENFPFETKISNIGSSDYESIKINIVADRIVESSLDNFMEKDTYDIGNKGYVDKSGSLTNGTTVEDISHEDVNDLISDYNSHKTDTSKHFTINDASSSTSTVYSSSKVENRIDNHNHEISNLTDVDITDRADGEALIWDDGTSTYIHGEAGKSNISEMDDVSITSISSGETLVWDETSSKFKNGDGGKSNLSEMDDVDLTDRADGTTLVWDESTSKYIHGISSALEYVRLRKYTFTSTDVTNAQTDGYLDIDIIDDDSNVLEISDNMNNNGIEIIIGRLHTYYGTVSSGDDWELQQGTAPSGYANIIRIHEDWIVEGEIISGYVIKEKDS